MFVMFRVGNIVNDTEEQYQQKMLQQKVTAHLKKQY